MNPKDRWRITFLFVLLQTLSGCGGLYRVVEFQVLEPATVSFPENVHQLIVLNRAPFTMDVLQEEDRQDLDRKHLLILDTLVTRNLFRGLLEVLRQSPIEKFHTPLWLNERRPDTAGIRDLQLTKREVEEYCSEWGGDAIISLESYSLDVEEHKIYFEDSPGILSTMYVEVSNRIWWVIYLRGNPTPFDSYRTVDTLYFTTYQSGQFLPEPSAQEMLAETFSLSGAKYGRYLVPVWNDASRLIFKGKNDTLKQAAKLTAKRDWEGALELWAALGLHGDSLSRSRAYHNMAVYYELEDRLDSSYRYLELATRLDTSETTREYYEDIATRRLNKKELQIQIQ